MKPLKKPSYKKICQAIKKGEFGSWPPEVQEEALREKDPTRLTVLLWAVQRGWLDQIPSSLLTEERLLEPDSYGNTPLHESASWGRLDQLPKEVLSEKNLCLPNNYGTTPLHKAAREGFLDQIPQNLLTEEILFVSDHDGWNTLHYAARNDNLPQISFCLSLAMLTELLLGEKTSESSREWIRKELGRQALCQTLQKARHGDL